MDHSQAIDRERPLIVVSCDSHAGPRLEIDLRPYCPKKHLQAFDDWTREFRGRVAGPGLRGSDTTPEGRQMAETMANNRRSHGHHDMAARLREMDQDGVAAEVIFPTSMNGEPQPFIDSDLLIDPRRTDRELMEAGQDIYARWLADAVKAAPERLIGLVTPPLWDPERSVEHVEWAAKAGLRGVFLLAPRIGIPRYDDAVWDPFWAACEANGMFLSTHSGSPLDVKGSHMFAMMQIESGGWPARSSVHQLIFSGVFERHPKLNLIITEQNFDWWTASAREFDSAYLCRAVNHVIGDRMTRKASDYMRSNVFIGASFLARFEAEDAVKCDYADNVVWGRDYPHLEGTWVFHEDDDPATNPSRLSLRHALETTPDEAVVKIAGANGVRAFGLDEAALQAIAERISAPSVEELKTPIGAIPEIHGGLAYRELGAWY